MLAEDDLRDKDCSVRVAVRIRPQNSRELIDMCRICSTVTPEEPQIILGSDKAFTFDYVYDINANQCDIYTECVARLVEGALHGYNATVLAYGQTGSGKTYTMGTGFDHTFSDQQLGIIPRAVRHLFAGIDAMHQPADEEDAPVVTNAQFSVAVQFIELYNEDIVDLLDPYSKGRNFKIHESGNGQITVAGATIKPIHEPQDALKYLQQGALARTTASTKMNDQSSRSHALFTILIRRQRVLESKNNFADNDLETLTSKFHFVDLAGSERLKRTLATGDRAREGISINCGLLALGNCISALGDKSKRATHVPYRDSKLTRLLQDSLGGNSQTLMIACVSPSDRDFMETLNTLKYANRARNIKNKVQINQDQSSRTISQLRREIAALQLELLEYKQGSRLMDCEGNTSLSDTFYENAMLLADNKRLQQRLKSMQETIHILTERNAQLKLEKESQNWIMDENSDSTVTNIVGNYLSEIEKLQAKLIESERMYQQLKKANSTNNSPRGTKPTYDDPEDIINIAKRGLEKERELFMTRSLPGIQDSNIQIEDQESSESDSDSEAEDKTNEMEADLNDINSDIEIKTKLIEQLELSQKRMQIMRQHYEEKLTVLTCKISNTQKERDEVLANMVSNPSVQSTGDGKKIKMEYERKLTDMQRELKRLQQAQREHIRQQRELKTQEIKLQNLRFELNELKCSKVKLMKKISEQTSRHKEEDTRKSREIAQLRKEQRRQQNTVLSLQAKVNAKEQILRRKTEEVSALRKSQRGTLSKKAAGRVALKNEKNIKINSRAALVRWENMSRTISHAARNKQLITQLEKELERLMNEREELSRELTGVQAKGSDDSNEEDNLKTNISYVQENIEHVQQAVMEFEEGKDSAQNDTHRIQSLLDNVTNVDEAKYLLQRLTDNAISMSCNSAMSESRLQEYEALLKEAQQESSIQQQLLQHFLSQNSNVQISDLFDSLNLTDSYNIAGLNRSGSQKSLISNGTYDIPQEEGMDASAFSDVQLSKSRSSSPALTNDASYDKSPKVRRRTARRQDLLFGDGELQKQSDPMTRSYTQHEPMQRNIIPLMRVPSAPGSLKQPHQTSPKMTAVPVTNNSLKQSPRLGRRSLSNKTSSGLIDNANETPVYHRLVSREDPSVSSSNDVFSRLGAGTQDPLPGGNIKKNTGKIRLSDPLYCTHVVSGHSNSVLSIKVQEDILYTAAADRTVKVWNLTQETAQHCLGTHPGPVIAIQNVINSGLLFSASGPYVRVWDLRVSNTRAIKTISSSGLLLSGFANITGTAPGEVPVTAMCLGPSGNLYVAASDKVRIWDLNTITCIGKLSSAHQAAIMCMASFKGDNEGTADYVVTGSKDHYVKVFEVPRAGGIAYPLLNLEPPHYDGVQALVVSQSGLGTDVELFSGSRDSGIKQWDLTSGKLKQSLNNAHKGWVSAMAISGDMLLSGCRGGVVRLWNVNTCESIAEMKTELMINDIATNADRIFTASSDGNVRVWRWNNNLRRLYPMESS